MVKQSKNTPAENDPQKEDEIEGSPTLPHLYIDMDKIEKNHSVDYVPSFFTVEDSDWGTEGLAPESIVTEVAEAAKNSLDNSVVTESPTELDEGSQMTSFLLRNNSLSVLHYSNQTFSAINPNEVAHVALTGLRFDNQNLNIQMSEFDFDDKHESIALAKISDKVLPSETLDEEDWFLKKNEDLPTKQETSLRVNYNMKRKELTCNTTSQIGPRCFFIDSTEVSDVTGAIMLPITKHGYIVILSTDMMKALIRGVTKGTAYKIYKEFKLTSIDQTKEKQIELPLEFIISDADNYLKSLVEEAFSEQPMLSEDFIAPYNEPSSSFTDSPVKRLFLKLSEIQKNSKSAHTNKLGTVNTDSFVIYELPD